jgi:hypothetical protein
MPRLVLRFISRTPAGRKRLDVVHLDLLAETTSLEDMRKILDIEQWVNGKTKTRLHTELLEQ